MSEILQCVVMGVLWQQWIRHSWLRYSTYQATGNVHHIGSRAAGFKQPLLSVDVSVCLSATLLLN